MVKKTFLACALLWAAGAARLYAGGETSADFLRLQAGARASGMGGAFTALADDAGAVYWNPAGLAGLEFTELTFTHLALYSSLNYEYLAYAQLLSDNEGLGAQIMYLWLPEFNNTEDQNGVFQDPISGRMNSLAISAGYGLGLGKLEALGGVTRLGWNIKVISQTLMDHSELGLAADAGLLIQSAEGVSVALVSQNMGPQVKDDALPLLLKLGLGYRLPNETKDLRLRLALDVTKPIDLLSRSDLGWETSLGTEYLVSNLGAVRLGYHAAPDQQGLTAGLGLRLLPFLLDYAFADLGVVGYTHRFSLSICLPR